MELSLEQTGRRPRTPSRTPAARAAPILDEDAAPAAGARLEYRLLMGARRRDRYSRSRGKGE
jgi:hypothetical protein